MADKGFIVYPTYKVEKGKASIHLFGRLENGESFLTVNKFRPYFYIKSSDRKTAEKLLKLDYLDTDFTNFEGEKVTKVIADIPKDVPKIKRVFLDDNIVCYEADIRFAYRFLIDKDIKGSMSISGDFEKGERVDRVYIEPLLKPSDYRPDLKVLSFDIEADLGVKNLYAISLYGKCLKTCLILKKGKFKNAETFANERELLERFKELIISYDPDVLTGWNVVDFDLVHLRDKFKENKVKFDLGRIDWPCRLRITDSFFIDSSADVPGRVVLDGIRLTKMSFLKLPDYKLNTAAKEFLGQEKIFSGEDRHKEITDAYNKDPQLLIDYNIKDSRLVYDIIEKTNSLKLTVRRSMLTRMQPDRVDGSIASLDSLYLKELQNRKIVAPSAFMGEGEERIKGGYVRKSKPGIYDNIIVMDFKSMYPSIMRTFNIDPYGYLGMKVKKYDKKKHVKAPNGAYFRNESGVLSHIIQILWEQRDAAKKRKDVLASHAIKILMNSFFGVLANPACRFYSRDMANAITHYSQFLIQLCADKVSEMGYDVIYGDSITKNRFVTLLIDGKLHVKNVEGLFTEHKGSMKNLRNKERINLSDKNILALTVNKKTLKPEFSPVIEIIRHQTNKKIYRVNQKYGETVCTEDHSLMTFSGNNLQETKPSEIDNKSLAKITKIPALKSLNKIDLYEEFKHYNYKIRYKGRTKILCFKKDDKYIWFGWTNRKKQIKVKRFIEIETPEFESLCRILGAYIAEGSSSTRETTIKKGASIAAGDFDWLRQLKKDYLLLFRNARTSIIKSSKTKRTLNYRTLTANKTANYDDCTFKLQMMNETSALFFKLLCGQTSKRKKLPSFVYHVKKRYKEILLNNMILCDGSKETDKKYSEKYRSKHFRYHSSSLQLISGTTLLLTQLGLKYSIQYDARKKSYRIISSDKNNTNLNTKIQKEPYSGYVYDLAIKDNNMFVDSCGQILLHNTDSIFVNSGVKNYKEALKKGEEMQKFVNAFFDKYITKEYKRENFMEIEFEKVYKKFLMPRVRHGEAGAKKRYAGLLVKDGKDVVDFVGLEFVRRDWTELAKKFQMKLFDKIFHERPVVKFVQKFVADLRAGKYDPDLVYRKAIRKCVEEYTKTTPPHIKAARKAGVTGVGVIAYYMTTDGPEIVEKKKHALDYDHYIEKQIKPIADSVLSFYDTNFDDLLKGTKQKDLFSF